MTEYQITYWREFPSMVVAREGRSARHKVQLPARFQVAIDEAAMRAGAIGTDEYLDGWLRTDWQEQAGDPQEVAQAVAAQLEADYPPQRLRKLLSTITPDSSSGGWLTPRPHPVVERLNQHGGPLLGDGAMATMLQEVGLTGGAAPELWNVDNPQAVQAVYRGYVEAGSHIITTNTFGGTTARLKMHDLQDRLVELNAAGVQLARAVADEFGDVLGGGIGRADRRAAGSSGRDDDGGGDDTLRRAGGGHGRGRRRLHSHRDHERSEGGGGRGARRGAGDGTADRLHAHFRYQPAHDDGRQPQTGGGDAGRLGRTGNRGQLRQRPDRDPDGDD